MSIEQTQSRIDVLKAEAMVVLRNAFMRKVQLEDEKESNEINLHFHRGLTEGLELAKKAMAEIQRGNELAEKIEELKKTHRFQDTPVGSAENLASNDHDDSKKGVEVISQVVRGAKVGA